MEQITALISSSLEWFAGNAAIVLVLSVLGTVGGERILRRHRGDAEPVSSSRTSISAGLAYIVAKGIVSKVAMFALAMWIYTNHAVFDLSPFNPLVWLALFVLRDFVYYWIHRAEHQVNVLWASHMIHHSATHFSFTTAVRMPWMEALYKPVLALWAPLLGFHPLISAAIGAIVLIVGQFHHTELRRKQNWLDKIFVTPGAHRVHHGSNQVYLDKNFGSLFIVWDRMFGTYQPETERVVYGLTGGKQVNSPKQALIGGYGDLISRARGRSPRQQLTLALARPS